MYRALRPLLFRLEPERAHALTLGLLSVARRLNLHRLYGPATASRPVRLMGLTFPNRVGLAAGLDKNAACIDALGALGFGFVEVGTVTPRPQPGNPRPRLFRIPRAEALVNAMGFPNEGVEAACARLRERSFAGVCGVNIGKNATTPLADAAADYAHCLQAVYPLADYVAINVSSPNTPGLRQLQAEEHLKPLLESLIGTRERLAGQFGRRVPLLVKLSPDLAEADLEALAAVVRALGIDGVIATNTTVQRPGVADLPDAARPGGLSGRPLHALSTSVVRRLRALLPAGLPIVGVGGISSLESAREMLEAGADLIQIYTGLIYRGPRLVRVLSRL
jgi:dihydroorotate dehydrogenase subfamily 2